jgi:uncharacterized protein (DUF983 family)
MPQQNIPALGGIVHQLCPRCREGRIFRSSIVRGFPRMHENCPVCGLKFQREQGYFLGAMYISFGLGTITIVLLGVLLWALMKWRLEDAALWAFFLFLPLAPGVAFFSRVLWIYLDQALDPEPK